MNRTARLVFFPITACSLIAASAWGQAAPPANHEAGADPVSVAPIAAHDGPVVQIALLLDTSNSMDGLIDQAKAALWAIVNDLTLARDAHGAVPQIQIAIYEYGNDSISASVGFVRQRTPFTTDLDLVSGQLFGLRTDGGSEFCGRAIQTAVADLDWWLGDTDADIFDVLQEGEPAKPLDRAALDAIKTGIERPRKPRDPGDMLRHVDANVVRMLVIAGNEPFNQGRAAYQEAIASARALGITVSTIHCGDRETGIAGQWQHGAKLGGGLYAHIDQNESAVEPPTPFDAKISQLNNELNTTYLAFNRAPASRAREAQLEATRQNDGAGLGAKSAPARAGSNYANGHWDVVDAVKRDGKELDAVPEQELPAELAELSADERKAKIDGLWQKRRDIQAQINEQAKQRAAFVQEHFRQSGDERFDQAIVRGLRQTARAAGLTFIAEPGAIVEADTPSDDQ